MSEAEQGLPEGIRAELESALGAPVSAGIGVKGGEINRTAQVTAGGETVFVKWSERATEDVFRQEARGLGLMRATDTLRVPRVLALGETVPFLAMEWIDEGIIFDRAAWSRGFAAGLAAMHRAPAPANYGLDVDNYLGHSVQPNGWMDRWPEFWRDRRIGPQIGFARERGIGAERLDLLARVQDRMDSLLDCAARPSLLHGDLWSGNYMTASAGAVLVDPAVYYGDREAELAYIELFGGFPGDFVHHYGEAWPLEEGYERRRPVHQLYYLLTHYNHFGEPYGQDVERVCRRLLS